MKYVITAITAICLLLGCATTNETSTAVEPERQIERGIPYVNYGEEQLTLTLVRPAHVDGPIPALVLIHGGGFSAGSPSDFSSFASLAADRGYAAFLVQYRLTKPGGGIPKNQFPAAIHDIKAAVRWIREHASEYSIDQNRIGLVGFSSGANLALVAGVTGPEDDLEGEEAPYTISSKVQAVVAAAPTYVVPGPELESVEMMRNAWAQYLGGTIGEIPQRYESAGPVPYLDPDDPPLLIIVGSQDPFASLYQARAAVEALETNGVGHSVVAVPGSSHDFDRLAAPRHDYPLWSFLKTAFADQ